MKNWKKLFCALMAAVMLLSLSITTGVARAIADDEPESGTLTVSKEVVNGDEDLEFNFEAALTFYNDPAHPWDSSMATYINWMMYNSGVFTDEQRQAISQQFFNAAMNSGDPVSEIIVTTTFTLKHGESVEFDSLPGGTDYTITEAGTAGYVASADGQTAAAGASLTVTGTIDGEKTLAFVNTISEDPTYEPGTLTVSKEVVNGDEDLEFNFDLSMTLYNDPAEPWSMSTISYLNAMREVSGIFTSEQLAPVIAQLQAYIMSDGAEPLDEINLTTTFTLKHGESVEIPLPGGTDYTITEAGTEGYEPSADGQTAAAGASLTVSGTIDGDKTLAFVNTISENPTYEPGTLTVSKEVVNGDEDLDFNFDLSMTLYNDPAEPWSMSTISFLNVMRERSGIFTTEQLAPVIAQLEAYIMNDGAEPLDEINLTTTFTLKHGESVEIPLLGGATYTVTEAGTEGYVPSADGQTAAAGASLTVTGTIDGDKTLAFVNTYGETPVYEDGSLTVTKTNVGGNADDEFTFTLAMTLYTDRSTMDSSTLSRLAAMKQSNGGMFDDDEIQAAIDLLYDYILNNGNGEPLESVSFSATFTLKGGESIKAPSLFGGADYTLTETGVEGYVPSANGQTAAAGASLTVTGTIDGDETVAFVNTFGETPVYEPGTLTVSKEVVNGDEDLDFNFEAALTFYNNPAARWDMSTVSYICAMMQNSGVFTNEQQQAIAQQFSNAVMNDGDPVAEITVTTTFTLKHGESVEFMGLPGGTDYTITEAGTEGYVPSADGQTAAAGASLTVTGTIDGDKTLAFVNTYGETPVYEDGSLTVTKTNVGGNADDEFTFTLAMTLYTDRSTMDSSTLSRLAAMKQSNGGMFDDDEIQAAIDLLYDYILNNGNGEPLESVSFSATFTLKGGESIKTPSLFGGADYTLTETGVEGYVPSADGQTAAAGASLTVTGTIDGDETVAFVNTYGETPVYEAGTLTVSKEVVNGDEDLDFNFDLSMTFYNNPAARWDMSTVSYICAMMQNSGVFTNEQQQAIAQQFSNAVMNDGDPVAEITVTTTFTLKHGESVEFMGLPGGTDYTITEAGTEGYVATANGQRANPGQDLTVTGTIDGDATVAYKNVVPRVGGGLTISKEVVNGDADQEFNFELTIAFHNDPDYPWTAAILSSTYAMLLNSGLFTSEEADAIMTQLAAYCMNAGDAPDPITATTTFTLKHGESKTFPSLVGGTDYTITETGTEGYAASANGQTAAAGQDLTVTGIIDGDATVAFVNTYGETPVYEPGTLTISKEVVGGDETLDFNFDLSMTLYNDPAEPWSMATISYLNAMREVSGIFTTEQLAPIIEQLQAYIMSDGAVPLDEINLTTTFTLKHGESVEIPLPGGATYTVTEAGTEGYEPSADGQTAAVGASLTVSGTIDGDKTLAFVNTFDDNPEFRTHSLMLDGKIGINFYMYLPDSDAFEYDRMDFTISGKDGLSTSVPYSSGMKRNRSGELYGFAYYVNTIQMADTITAKFYYTKNGEEKMISETYSVLQYFLSFDTAYEANPTLFPVDIVNMITATADLGHYVQKYLDKVRPEWQVPDDHADMYKFYTTYTDADVTEAAEYVAPYALVAEGNTPDVALSYKLELESEMALRVILVPKNGYTGPITATLDGANCAVTPVDGLSKYIVECPNVKAHQLSKTHTFVITTDNGSVTIKGSGLSYAHMMLQMYRNDPDGQYAAVAIYRYSKFADILKPEG